MPKKDLTFDQIRIDGETQPRVSLSSDTVAEYADAWRAGTELPALVVFFDGSDYWLAEGFHRLFGAQQADLLTIPCDVRKGTLKDARTHAAGSNVTHGLKRTNADKRKAVGMMLEDHPEWSDRKIADHCSVGAPLVAELRVQVKELTPEKPAKRTGKDGKTYSVASKPKPEPVIAPIVQEKIEANGIKSSSAERERLAELPPTQQRAVVDAVISGASKTIGGAMGDLAPNPTPAASIVLDAIKRPIPKHLTEKHATAAQIQSAATILDRVKHALEDLKESEGAEFLQFSPVFESLKDLKKQISDARYWSECPRCQGKVNPKCDRCDGHGYLPFSRKGQLSAEDKAYLGVEK